MVTAKERKSWEKCKRFKTQKELALARLDAEIANHRAILTEQYAEMEFITKNCAEGALVTAKERDSWEEYKRLKAQKDPELARLDAEIAGHKATLAELYAEMESSMEWL